MPENSHQSFTELEVWKKTRILKCEIFELIKTFPAEEKFRLSDQIIRSSRGINATIAEGHGRFTYKDQLHFCVIARGSLSETYNHLIDALDCRYITEEKLIYFKMKIDEVERLLNGYIIPKKKFVTCQINQ
jgi:four helix bundle protein